MTDQEKLIWINEDHDPNTVTESPEGGYHIPIEKLKPLLNELDPGWSRENFKWNYVTIGGSVFFNSSVDILVEYGGLKRKLCGASTFDVATYQENTHYAAIGLANSTKNACLVLGKRFGSELNLEEDAYATVGKANGKSGIKRSPVKMPPDASIRKQYAEAAVKGDHELIKKLELIYDFKIG